MATNQVQAFINCTPGMETELKRELEEIRPLCLSASARFGVDPWILDGDDRGGVTLTGTLISVLQVNFWSKLASRVLLRIDGFHATSLPRLRERMKTAPTAKYFGGEKFEIRVEAHRCKVSNEKTIRRVAEEVWPVAEKSQFRLYLRGWHDDWTVSLDTTGEHLHRRGYRKQSGGAPLRETLAALTLRHLIGDDPVSSLRKVQLLDPMAGTGTFLREGNELYLPQRQRDFSFLHFKNCPPLLKSPSFWDNYRKSDFAISNPLFGRTIGIDKDDAVLKLMQENIGEKNVFAGNFQNFTSREKLKLDPHAPLWIVSNPPYGERLNDLGWMQDFWPWAKELRPDKIALWLPKNLHGDFLELSPVAPNFRLPISNGGIDCAVLFFSQNPA